MDDVGYALVTYSTSNLGDDIQSLAAQQMLPRIDMFVDRERLHRDPGTRFRRLKIILNGWFMQWPSRWPPHATFEPLLVSMHINPLWRGRFRLERPASKFLLTAQNSGYLRDHGPVGARDLQTLHLLEERGLDAYLSGCLTLALQRDASVVRRDYVVANDLDVEVLDTLKRQVGGHLVTSTHNCDELLPTNERMKKAVGLLQLYACARAVVTTRLHCALPCLALGTPVLLVHPRKRLMNRFNGLLHLFWNVTREGFLSGMTPFDFQEPQPNSGEYTVFRELLVERCRQFVTR